ncbi:hypothetical protein [Massilia sp. CT11-137]|uniref:hypothetical protein n=1 Tax=Massilia sp. CT11-137 TaxID=3393901 RepID=UPI0039B0277D
MVDLKMETERAAPCPWCGEVPDVSNDASFRLTDGVKYGALQCCIVGPEVRTDYKDVPHWKAKAIAAWNDRRASPVVGDDGLPPPDVHASGDMFGAPTAYSAAKVRDAIAADRAARANSPEIPDGCAQQQTQSIDTPEFQAKVGHWLSAREYYQSEDAEQVQSAWVALIAYIDGRTAGAAPEGWKLVPIEPTMDMAKAGAKHTAIVEGEETEATTFHEAIGRALYAWQDMLAAAPSPQQGKEGA